MTNKKAVSIMVGYVLLVVFAVIIGAVVYQWLSTYIPKEPLGCPEGSSLFVKDAIFDSSNSELNLTLRNNGRFNIAGYFIHAKNSSSQELAIIDLSIYLDESSGGSKFGNSVLFAFSGENSLKPGNKKTNIFDIPPEIGKPYSVRIIPTRFQEEDNRERFVSCGDARVEQIVGAPPVICIPENISVTCGTWVCGEKIDNCGDRVSCPPGCTGTDVCDSTGSCVPAGSCTDTCSTFGYGCGTWTICGASTDCGTCSAGESCNATGQCVVLCGNGIIDPGEQCDDGNTNSGDGCSLTCTLEAGWECIGEPSLCSIASCPSYCLSLGGYVNGVCRQNQAQCNNNLEVWESAGDIFCLGGPTGDFCCCIP